MVNHRRTDQTATSCPGATAAGPTGSMSSGAGLDLLSVRMCLHVLEAWKLACCPIMKVLVCISRSTSYGPILLLLRMMSDYSVETINDGLNEFNVEFHGPKESLYEGGVWKIRVELPDAYPYKSPSIGFVNKIFHPNVDELSGAVCLDVINQSWSPMFDLLNVFEVFLPQLLLYPNPSDPLNGDAASLMMKDRKQYDQKVKEYCERYAKREHITNSTPDEDSGEDHITDEESGSSDNDIAGHVDP
ncbi:hypothetical protein FNV43_RR19820 [Rhamnella rubrinervis]|uniref:E2 ubiquitin-conjugating enzyme n=1 Tax=Rhamnella rubrinervis TaxID=2594499 RepID=A0A8K0GPV8_9ROSA|nr:hypothetical protein FNV43_RR19820 [Rhamnella rubrinervis]